MTSSNGNHTGLVSDGTEKVLVCQGTVVSADGITIVFGPAPLPLGNMP